MSSGPAISAVPARPRWTIDAWIDLHLRPGAFFAEQGRRVSVLVPVLLVGMAAVIDRIDTRMAFAELRGGRSVENLSWPYYWLAVVAGGCVAGPVGYYVQGWWVRVRAGFCSAPNANRVICRRIAALTSCIAAIPAIAGALIETILVAAPSKTTAEGPTLFSLLMGSIAWSVYASFQAVSTNLPVARRRAVFWFAVLPGAFYGLVLIGIVAAYWRSPL